MYVQLPQQLSAAGETFDHRVHYDLLLVEVQERQNLLTNRNLSCEDISRSSRTYINELHTRCHECNKTKEKNVQPN